MVKSANVDPSFWKGRRVLLTGHTGFKGAWAAAWLCKMGAEVTGLSLPPEGEFSLYGSLAGKLALNSQLIDIRDQERLKEVVQEANPEIVLHMAAQALVRRSYREPISTFETNVMGTINLLQALSELTELGAALIVTSDKVYLNNEDGRAFRETDPLGGDDPYSSSKAACEIATASFAKSFFATSDARIATARAGNVIGGGDFSEDRLIPDIWRAAREGKTVTLRYPEATRPWQHVLESVSGYLVYLQALAGDEGAEMPKALNFGPADGEVITVGRIAQQVQNAFGIEGDWGLVNKKQPPEKSFLALDASLAEQTLGWRTKWNGDETLTKTVDWYQAFSDNEDIHALTLSQIEDYET
ncbi:CDP-glucose 4,6-dehydratase [uncultured Sneathiella sp.]|uniref:CDP-glucose 4,6-dehydratase n=1 Tax=uncultured Sneathiella sp. TaxID=879315 RepID=UPI0030D99DBD